MRRLIISDVHLGTRFYNAKKLKSLLEKEDFDELILAGDIIDFIKIPHFTSNCAEIIETIKNENIKYIIGNHDISFKEWSGRKILGINFLNEYRFVCNKRKFLISHGHQYETGLINKRFIMNIVSVIQGWIESAFNFNLGAWFHQHVIGEKKLLKIRNLLENCNSDVFIMGHTHSPEALIWVNENLDIKTYVNCGDWVEHSTYVIIEPDGQVELRKI